MGGNREKSNVTIAILEGKKDNLKVHCILFSNPISNFVYQKALKQTFPLKWRIFLIQKYPFIPRGIFHLFVRRFIQRFSNETPCPQIFLKDVRRFSTTQIKCRYLHKINEKSRAGINGLKNPYYGNDISTNFLNFGKKC